MLKSLMRTAVTLGCEISEKVPGNLDDVQKNSDENSALRGALI